MDEFLENFNEFKNWLNNLTVDNEISAKTLNQIREKFDKLNLNKPF